MLVVNKPVMEAKKDLIIEKVESSEIQDLAGKAILFEIGAKLGILEVLENQSKVTTAFFEKNLNIPNDFIKTYLDLFESLELLNKNEDGNEVWYSLSSKYPKEKNKVGYVAWSMISCAPLIEHAKAFVADFNKAVSQYHRQGEHVARTSKWMGEKDFYPHAEKVILKLNPKKMIDLGSGTCGLLIALSQKIKNLKSIGVDVSQDACKKASELIKEANLENRIEVLISPIQSLTKNSEVFREVDVVHAGFVLHDLMPEDEVILDALLATIHKVSPNATLVIVDAIPYSNKPSERAFSGAFTFLHKFFMGRKLLSEEDWKTKLIKAGFKRIDIEPLGISGGRIFVARGHG